MDRAGPCSTRLQGAWRQHSAASARSAGASCLARLAKRGGQPALVGGWPVAGVGRPTALSCPTRSSARAHSRAAGSGHTHCSPGCGPRWCQLRRLCSAPDGLLLPCRRLTDVQPLPLLQTSVTTPSFLPPFEKTFPRMSARTSGSTTDHSASSERRGHDLTSCYVFFHRHSLRDDSRR